MQQVILKPMHHRGEECIGILYDNYPSFNTIVKKIPKVQWSQTNKCWYLPLSSYSYNQICKALKEKANLEITELKKYLEKSKKA